MLSPKILEANRLSSCHSLPTEFRDLLKYPHTIQEATKRMFDRSLMGSDAASKRNVYLIESGDATPVLGGEVGARLANRCAPQLRVVRQMAPSSVSISSSF